jgi:hypothetical protein
LPLALHHHLFKLTKEHHIVFLKDRDDRLAIIRGREVEMAKHIPPSILSGDLIKWS